MIHRREHSARRKMACPTRFERVTFGSAGPIRGDPLSPRGWPIPPFSLPPMLLSGIVQYSAREPESVGLWTPLGHHGVGSDPAHTTRALVVARWDSVA